MSFFIFIVFKKYSKQQQSQEHYCKIKGHENQLLVPNICSSSSCDQISRYLCQKCLLEGLHSHNNQKLQFLGKEQLIAQFQAKISELKKIKLEKLIAFDELLKGTLNIIEEFFQQQKNCQQQQNNQSSDQDDIYFEALQKLITESFYQLTFENMNKILNISENKISSQKIELFNKNYQQFIQTLTSLKINFSDLKVYDTLALNQNDIDDKIKRFIYSEQSLQDLKANSINSVTYSQQIISPNNLYLATVSSKYESINKTSIQGNQVSGCTKYYFELLDLQTKKTFSLKFKNTKIDFPQFSINSRFLYYKENNEPFYCFLNLKLDIQRIQAFSRIKYNGIEPSQLVKIMNYSYLIWNINTYYFNRKLKCQLFNYAGQYLEFWDEKNGNKLYESTQKQELEQLILQQSQGESKLFTFEKEFLYKFQIEYNQNQIDINTLQKFKYESKIVSYSLVWNQQYFVVFGEFGIVTIFDYSFKMIKHFFIGSEEDKRIINLNMVNAQTTYPLLRQLQIQKIDICISLCRIWDEIYIYIINIFLKLKATPRKDYPKWQLILKICTHHLILKLFIKSSFTSQKKIITIQQEFHQLLTFIFVQKNKLLMTSTQENSVLELVEWRVIVLGNQTFIYQGIINDQFQFINSSKHPSNLNQNLKTKLLSSIWIIWKDIHNQKGFEIIEINKLFFNIIIMFLSHYLKYPSQFIKMC
ncbi:hypothetical protein pb186bvf_008004 [Paramecium bursaria]